MTTPNTTMPAAAAGGGASLTAPVSGSARIQSIDTLRGMALFGILLLNIIAFANPFAAYLDPRVDGATAGLDLATFMIMDILFEGSMRTIFSMLFGAGMLIFLNKPGSEAAEVKVLYYRRTLLLVMFGLFNAYLLVWPGDILYTYGMTGLLLYLFRDFPARRLLLASVALFALLTLLHSGFHYQARVLGAAAADVQALPPGTPLSEEQEQALDNWNTFLEQQFMTPEQIQKELQIKQSGYVENFLAAAQTNVFIQSVGLLFNALWDAGAMMLLGMALMKWRVFDASHGMGFYVRMMVAGFAIGIPLNAWETLTYINSDFAPHWNAFSRPSYDVGRLSLAIGYIGLVMVVCKSGALAALRTGLARVGQMALSNYLLQSVICNLVFLGFGFGLAGELRRHQIYYVVFAVWGFQLIFSVLWLHRFRFGPAEWLWRSLTYGRAQAMRLS